MPISDKVFKQVELFHPEEKWASVIWLPSKVAKEGNVLSNGSVVKIAYDIKMYQCQQCKRLCNKDVVDCLCHYK